MVQRHPLPLLIATWAVCRWRSFRESTARIVDAERPQPYRQAMKHAVSLLTRSARAVGHFARDVVLGSSGSRRSDVDAARDGHRSTDVDRAQAHLRASTTSSQIGGIGSGS